MYVSLVLAQTSASCPGLTAITSIPHKRADPTALGSLGVEEGCVQEERCFYKTPVVLSNKSN